MASILESLANELLNLILENLDVAGQARLLQCSNFLRRRIEAVLYDCESTRDVAMEWACLRGGTHTIRLLVRYGCNLDTYNQPVTTSHPDLDVRPTLFTTAKERQDNSFALLLEHGAKWPWLEPSEKWPSIERIGDGYPRSPLAYLSKFIEILITPKCEPLLRHYVKAGFGTQIENHSVRLIKRGASFELVRDLLNEGFIPQTLLNGAHKYSNHIPANTLSTAILRNSIPLFDLFIEKGTDINLKREPGENNLYLTYQPLYIPVFTAARLMPTHGLGWMQRCLDNGADINSCCVNKHFKWGKTNPLLFYIDSIKSWKPNKPLHPVDGINFLLEHNATFPNTGESIVVHLLERWGVNKLKYTNFFDTLRFLIENGEFGQFGSQILSYRQEPDLTRSIPISPRGVTAWTSLVGTVLELRKFEETEKPENDALHTLLQDYILEWPRSYHGLSSLEEGTVEGMIRAGASVNAVTHKRGKSALQILCEPWYNMEASHLLEHENIHDCSKFRRRMRLLKFLVDKGGARTEAEIERLMTAMRGTQIQDKEKLYLFCLIAALKGKKHLPKKLPGKYKNENSDRLSKTLSEFSI